MTTLSNMTTDVRSRLVEPTARLFSDAEIQRWINRGYHDFMVKTEWATRLTAFAVVANQFEYTIPSDFLKIEKVRWQDKYDVEKRDMDEFTAVVGVTSASRSDRPRMWMGSPWDKKIRLYPIPSTASASTTLNGGINSSVTSITLTDSSSFPAFGRILIDSEQILYFANSGNVLSQCVRGDGATTAASHSNAATVTDGKLVIYNRYDPPDLAASDSPVFSSAWDEALVLYATAVGMGKRDKWPEYDRIMELYRNRVKEALSSRTMQDADKAFWLKDDEANLV